MAFSRFDTFCQYLEMPFILLDFISHLIGFRAWRGRLLQFAAGDANFILFALCSMLWAKGSQAKPTLFFVLYALCFEPKAPQAILSLIFLLWTLNFALCSLLFALWTLLFALWTLLFELWTLLFEIKKPSKIAGPFLFFNRLILLIDDHEDVLFRSLHEVLFASVFF